MNLLEQLSKQAFWDTDLRTLDAEAHADFVITKAFEYGKLSDVQAVMRH